MSEIKDLMQKIKETKKAAEKDPGTNRNNYAVKLGFINRAKDDLEELYMKYRKVIQRQAIFILTTGSKKQMDLFAETAVEKFDCFRHDVEEFYDRVANEINPALYENKVSGASLFDVLGNVFEDFAQDIGIVSYPALVYNQKYNMAMKDKKDLVKVIKKGVNDKIGAELIGYYAIEMVSRKAVNKEFDAPVVPIVMECYDQELLKELAHRLTIITPNVFVISLGSGKIDDVIKSKSIACIEKALVTEVKDVMVKIKENLR